MEGKKVYEDSLEELKRLEKAVSMTFGTVDVNFSKLDRETAGQLKRSMYQVITKRKHEVESVIMNTNVEV